MQILNKYKKHFDQGFKDFVMQLDLLPPKVVKDIISNGVLEDPVYLKWALENKLNFETFLKLDKEDVLKVFRAISNPGILFLRALKSHPEENIFISNNLPSLILKQYLDDRESAQITMAQQADARIKIMQAIFQLKETGELSPMTWKLPRVEVLSGTSHTLDKLGNYKQYYDNEILAIEGSVIKGKRSGLWRNYYPNGAVHAEGHYENGEKSQVWSFYYLNGQLKSTGSYLNDLKNGEWKEFELNLDYKIQIYKNGKLAS